MRPIAWQWRPSNRSMWSWCCSPNRTLRWEKSWLWMVESVQFWNCSLQQQLDWWQINSGLWEGTAQLMCTFGWAIRFGDSRCLLRLGNLKMNGFTINFNGIEFNFKTHTDTHPNWLKVIVYIHNLYRLWPDQTSIDARLDQPKGKHQTRFPFFLSGTTLPDTEKKKWKRRVVQVWMDILCVCGKYWQYSIRWDDGETIPAVFVVWSSTMMVMLVHQVTELFAYTDAPSSPSDHFVQDNQPPVEPRDHKETIVSDQRREVASSDAAAGLHHKTTNLSCCWLMYVPFTIIYDTLSLCLWVKHRVHKRSIRASRDNPIWIGTSKPEKMKQTKKTTFRGPFDLNLWRCKTMEWWNRQTKIKSIVSRFQWRWWPSLPTFRLRLRNGNWLNDFWSCTMTNANSHVHSCLVTWSLWATGSMMILAPVPHLIRQRRLGILQHRKRPFEGCHHHHKSGS